MVTVSGDLAATTAQTPRPQRFSRADADQSGSLDREEFAGMRTRLPGGAAEIAGSAETSAASAQAEIFTRIDTDGNGVLSKAEIEAVRPRRPPADAPLSRDVMSALFRQQETQLQRGQAPAEAAAAVSGRPAPPPEASRSDALRGVVPGGDNVAQLQDRLRSLLESVARVAVARTDATPTRLRATA